MKTIEDFFANIQVYPAVFEKDNDNNFHIDFIHACSSMRAKNYKIPGCGREKTKMIAGKIIPAIATTTGMIAGAVMIELYKLVQNTEVQSFRNCFCNLALPLLVFSEPLPPLRFISKEYDPILMGPVKAYPEKFSTWDKLVVSGPCTLQEFIHKIEEAHKLRVKIVSSGQSCLYNSYLPDHKHDYRLPKQLHLLYEEVSETKILEGRHCLAIECSCEGIDSKVDVMIPVVKYTF
jgi:ubiquitin-activating enzyme E1